MKNKKIRKDDEAVSPVIAVILMVAITVVLSGVYRRYLNGGDYRGAIGCFVCLDKRHST
jgi:flagellin-like protein